MSSCTRSLNVVGRRVCKLRNENGLTQSEFIARCQVSGWQLSRETLAKIVSGIRRVNDAEVALLARVLGCHAEDLLSVSMETALRVARHSPTGEP